MGQLQDLVGSIVIGGIVLLMLVAFNGNMLESTVIQTYTSSVQGNLTAVTYRLEYDFRKMGYGITNKSDSAIVYADTSKITFKGDFNQDGKMDTLQYYVDTIKSGVTPNPHDKVLHRILKQGTNVTESQTLFPGLTRLKIQYFDTTGKPINTTPIAATNTIQSLKFTISLESANRIYDTRREVNFENPFNDTTYAGAYWERTFKPQNLRQNQ